jgi:hypothetical protein
MMINKKMENKFACRKRKGVDHQVRRKQKLMAQ